MSNTPITIFVTLSEDQPQMLILPENDLFIVVQATLGIQKLSWKLHGNASECVFVQGDKEHPPIKWLGPDIPGPNVFQPDPGVSRDGLTYTLNDNPIVNTTHTYPYQLCVKSGSVYYYTSANSLASTQKTPKIKNN